jgi:hypothetical protein
MLLTLSAILLIAVAVAFTLAVRRKDMPPPEPVSPTRHLEDRRAAIYENLRDLQFEYRVGKLSDADYQQTKLGLQKELAGVLAEMERIKSGSERPAQAAETEARPRPGGSHACPNCGAEFPVAMKFCGECGKAMA